MNSQGHEKTDYYEVLGLWRDATPADIKQARHHLALQYHPDHNPGMSDEKFKLMDKAYKVLSDPKLRAKYDRKGEEGLGESCWGMFTNWWSGARHRAAENASKPIFLAPLAEVMDCFEMQVEYQEIDQAIREGEPISEQLASSMRENALGHIVRAVQAANNSDFKCAKCGQRIEGLNGLCYCHEVDTIGAHCRNDRCCPNCKKSWLTEFKRGVSNWLNVPAEFFHPGSTRF